MKSFYQFISEARITQASTQAKRLGLVGNGHGDWYTRQGELKAKTINGKLHLYTAKELQKNSLGQETNSSNITSSNASGAKGKPSLQRRTTLIEPPQKSKKKSTTKKKSSNELIVKNTNKPLTVVFDSFDDDNISNNIIKTVKDLGGEFYIFPSRNSNIKELKLKFDKKISDRIVDNKNAENIYDVLQSINDAGVDSVNIVVRQSRMKTITNLSQEQNGVLYDYQMINIIPVDERSVREQYISGDIFTLGSLIESNGMIGKIVRRGSNHLICTTNDGNMFKSFINNASEIKINL
jgi:hypothetical protein